MRMLTSLLLLALAVPLAAQEQEIRDANLPSDLEWRLLRMFEDPARRFEGAGEVDRMEVIRGDVVAHRGPLRVAGRIIGDLAMVGGDVVIAPGGSVTGNVTVVGGQVRMEEDGRIGGTITSYGEAKWDRRRDRDRGDRDDDWDDDWDDDRDDRWHGWRDRGYSRLTLRTGSSYNRVEGLPVMFGPVIHTGGANPLRVEALAVWRSESGTDLDTDRMGYQASLEQFLGGERAVSVGASVFSLVTPLDRWQLSDLEASLATAVFHEDFRDYFDRTGWSAFLTVRPSYAFEARLAYTAEDHMSLPAADPWSLFDGDDAWRLQPLMAEGDLETVSASLTLDLRDDEDDPAEGWYAHVKVDRPVGGMLVRPELTGVTPAGSQRFVPQPAPGYVPSTESDLGFTKGLLDVRRYTPVGYNSQLNLRIAAGGALDREALPPQFQHALGGLGTLPGFDTFLVDCGARSAAGTHDGQRFFPAYGCDRFALGQAEYRGTLSLDFGFGEPEWDDDDWWDEVRIDMSPTWVVFMDAARGWAYGEPALGGDRDTGMLYDAGVGFLIEDVGIYAAMPLNGDVEQEPRFFIRLGRRF